MMSRTRFNAVFSGMTSVAKKVYEAVPISETWAPAQVASELVRSGANVEFRVISGCLNALRNAGLITEPTNGFFRREAIREKAEKPEIAKEEEMVAKPAPGAKLAAKSPMDRLGDLSQRVAIMATQLKVLADDIGDAAIDIQSHIETNEGDLAKLKQLQALLKGLA